MSQRVRRAALPLVASAVLVGAVLALAACGGSSSKSAAAATPAGQGPGGGRRFLRDPKVAACLKKQGVTLPTFRGGPGRGGPPPAGSGTNAQPPTSTNPRPPAGRNGRRFGGPRGNPAQFAKMQAALKKCGVSLPNRRFGGGGGTPPSGGGSGTTVPSSTTAS